MDTQAAYSAFQVACPTTPSAVRPCSCWKIFTALSVAAPKLPSTVSSGRALLNCDNSESQNCTCSTSLPPEPRRSTTPGQLPELSVPVAVSPSLVSSARSFTLT